jgi:hypothetical protein
VTENILTEFDFSVPLALSVEERFEQAVDLVKTIHRISEGDRTGVPLVPTGASPEEIAELEDELGMPLPAEYAAFLRQHRYLVVSDSSHTIYGLRWEDEFVVFSPWISNEHDPQRRYLVMGNCYSYADGDQLLMDLDDPEQRVFLYLHEARVYIDVPGSKIELYAPSFSLAVWRLAHSWFDLLLNESDESDLYRERLLEG